MLTSIKAALGAAIIVLTVNSVTAQTYVQSGPIAVVIDGRQLAFRGAAPIQRNGVFMVPLREVLSEIGGVATFSPRAKTVTVMRGTRLIKLTLGSRTARINARVFTLDEAPFTMMGETMVPASFIGRAFNMPVVWNTSNRVIAFGTLEPMRRGTVTAAYRRDNTQAVPIDRPIRTTARRSGYSAPMDGDFARFLEKQDYQLYLNDRVAWMQRYQNYRLNNPLSASERSGSLDNRYARFLRDMDEQQYNADTFGWQQQYNTYLRQRRMVTVLPQPGRWDEYERDRRQLMEQTDRLEGSGG